MYSEKIKLLSLLLFLVLITICCNGLNKNTNSLIQLELIEVDDSIKISSLNKISTVIRRKKLRAEGFSIELIAIDDYVYSYGSIIDGNDSFYFFQFNTRDIAFDSIIRHVKLFIDTGSNIYYFLYPTVTEMAAAYNIDIISNYKLKKTYRYELESNQFDFSTLSIGFNRNKPIPTLLSSTSGKWVELKSENTDVELEKVSTLYYKGIIDAFSKKQSLHPCEYQLYRDINYDNIIDTIKIDIKNRSITCSAKGEDLFNAVSFINDTLLFKYSYSTIEASSIQNTIEDRYFFQLTKVMKPPALFRIERSYIQMVESDILCNFKLNLNLPKEDTIMLGTFLSNDNDLVNEMIRYPRIFNLKLLTQLYNLGDNTSNCTEIVKPESREIVLVLNDEKVSKSNFELYYNIANAMFLQSLNTDIYSYNNEEYNIETNALESSKVIVENMLKINPSHPHSLLLVANVYWELNKTKPNPSFQQLAKKHYADYLSFTKNKPTTLEEKEINLRLK